MSLLFIRSCSRNLPRNAAAARPPPPSTTTLPGTALSSTPHAPLPPSSTNRRYYHIVHGIECIEVHVPLPRIGSVTTLEATAKSQDILVNMAIDDDLLNLPSGDPYGTVLWPAASAVATRLLSLRPAGDRDSCDDKDDCWIRGRSVVELGAGTGLVSIAAALGGASSVLATDYEDLPLRILEYAAFRLNGVTTDTVAFKTAHFDWCDPNQVLPPADVLVASDVMYEPSTGAALARRVHEALITGCHVLIGDSPGRAGRSAFLSELGRLGIQAEFEEIVGWTVTGTRHELICGPNSQSLTPTRQALVVSILELHPDRIPSVPN